MAWRDWFNRKNEIVTVRNNKGAVINPLTSNEILAWPLEPRMLFDGAVAATVQETATTHDARAETVISGSDAKTVTTSDSRQAQTHSDARENNSVAPANSDSINAATLQNNASHTGDIAVPAPATARHEVVFIDTSLQDYQTLASGIGPDVEVVLLTTGKDGLQQIADWAATHRDYDAIHLFSHGSEGKINLGSSVLNSTTLSTEAVQTALAAIGQSLTRDGDILLYGCDVGASSSGDALMAAIARATGADVAASTDATGSRLMGGNWTLEKSLGSVEALALHVDAYQALLTVVTFSSSDPDMQYTEYSVVRPVEGYDITFATLQEGGLGVDSTYGTEGLYAYAGTGSNTLLTIASPAGTTFDLNEMRVGTDSNLLHFEVQYGNGTSASFDVTLSGGMYNTLSSFPNALNDVTRVTISSQSYSAFASLTITDVKSLAVSAEPVIGNLNEDTVSFTEGGAPVLLDAGSNATLTDSDSTDFNGGNVTVSFAGNGVSGQDVLSVQNQGTAVGQIGLSGSSVTWGGVTIGTLSGGTNGSALVIALNASATPAAVQGLIHALTWQNTNNADPSTLTRGITVTVNDGDGATSVASTVSVNVTGVNDAPTLSATASSPTYSENGSAVALFSGAQVSTVEAGQGIDRLTLTVSNLSNGASEMISVDGTSIALTQAASGNTLTNGLAYSVSISGGTATLTLSSATGLSSAATASLINAITYRNSSENPTAANRVVTLTGVRDNGGTSNGGADSSTLSIASTVNVVAVNDAPTIAAPGSITVTEDIGTTLTGISFSDVDAGSAPVVATFSVNSGTLSALSGAGVTVGTVSGSSLTLTGAVADINAYIAAGSLSFITASNNSASATLSISINDGGNSGTGGAQLATTSLALAVTAVNDAPVNSVPGGQSVQQDGSLVFSSGNGNAIAISDVDAGSNNLQVTLTATHGRVTLGSTSGLTFTVGSGSADSTLTFTGTQTAINAALNGLIFAPDSGYSGSASLQMTTNDLGFTGSGGAQSDTDTVTIAVNANAPAITGMASQTANGVYGIGSTVLVNVNFDTAVLVDTSGGTPTLLLETGALDRFATYVSGSGTSTLVFSYTVQSGDQSADLDYASPAALALNGATIRDGDSHNAQLTLATPGSAGSLGANAAVVVDGVLPTATIVVSDTQLSLGETATVTITFPEAVSGFSNADLSVSNGTLSAVSSMDGGITWTAIFTPAAGNQSAGNLITLDNSGVVDAVGNAGSGTSDSNTFSIDTRRPDATIVISDTQLSLGETATVTITFPEAVSGFSNADLTVSNGTLSAVSSADGGITWTAIFTPTPGNNSTGNVMTLDNSGVTDLAGNAGSGITASAPYIIDHQPPEATITLSNTALKAGETATVTLTFQEAVTGLTVNDVSISNGTLSNLVTVDGGLTWTATLTPAPGVTATASQIVLDNIGIQDLAGNRGVGRTSSASFSIDSAPPRVTALSPLPTPLPQTLSYQLDFSEAVNGVDVSDFTVMTAGNATASIASVTALSPTRYLINLTGVSGNGSVQLSLNASGTGIADGAGNTLRGGFSGAVYQTPAPVPSSGTLPSRGYDSQPVPADVTPPVGGPGQISLLTQPVNATVLPGAPGGNTPTLTGIFRAADQRAANGDTVLASVFSHSGVTYYEPGVSRTRVSDISRPGGDRSTLSSVFGDRSLPGLNALEVFSGSSWQQVSENSIAPHVAPASVFGAPIFSMQLQQLNDDELQQLASLEGALKNIKPSV